MADRVNPTISRRRLLGAVSAGGSAFVLAACGTEIAEDETVSGAQEAELLNEVLGAEIAVTQAGGSEDPFTSGGFYVDPEDAVSDLRSAIEELGGTPVEASPDDASSELAEAQEAALQIALQAVRQVGTPANRTLVYRIAISNAGSVAATKTGATEIAPTAFAGAES